MIQDICHDNQLICKVFWQCFDRRWLWAPTCSARDPAASLSRWGGSVILLNYFDTFKFDEQTKRNIQKTFKKFYKKLDVISNEVEEVKNIAEKTQSLVSDILYKEGIEKIDAAFKTLMDGANNLNQTLG